MAKNGTKIRNCRNSTEMHRKNMSSAIKNAKLPEIPGENSVLGIPKQTNIRNQTRKP